MNVDYALMQAMFLAMTGWIATSHAIVHSRIKPQTRRWLIIPVWFVWMAFALGGPVYQGSVTVANALTTGASFTIGMALFFAMRALSSRRSR